MDLVGKTIGHFRIVGEIGKGGMGIVYEAQDLRLPRRVALKFLPGEVVADRARLSRFKREADALSSLNHPHICTVYEIGTHRRQPFIVMERLEGETLSDRLERGVLPFAEVFDFGLQIADALGAAHARGIVHRDIKPDNVFVTKDGVVKLLDFGVAKHQRPGREDAWAAEKRTSTTGEAVPGTPAYMSPEQIRQRQIDGRSDLFSFGVLLYRMTCGRHPFEGGSVWDTIDQVLHSDPPAPSSLRDEIPEGLDRCIATLLRKEREERYPSAHEVMEALRQSRDEAPPAAGAATASLAVLPFANRGEATNDYFGEGLADELITCLARLEGVRVTSRTSAFEFTGDEDLADVGRRLRVRCVLHGTVRRSGSRVRITARLVEAAGGAHLWSGNYDGDLGEIFDVQEDIAQRITQALQWRLQRYAGRPLLRRYTDDPEVYHRYLEGRYWLHQQSLEGFARAAELFESVLRDEPHFAPALAGLADYCTMVGFFGFRPPMEIWPEAKAKAQQAIAMDPSLGAAHTSLALALLEYEWDFAGAEREHQEAVRLAPGDARSRYFYGLHLMLMGRLRQARRELGRALELDPLSKQTLAALAYTFYYGGHYEEALDECRRAMALDATYIETYGCLGLTQAALGRMDESIQAFDEADRLTARQFPLARAFLAYALGSAGRVPEAREILDGLYAASQEGYVPPAYLAVGEMGTGNVEGAFAALEQAYAAKDATLLYLRILPVFQPLADDPRFEDLCRRVGLPPAGAVEAGAPPDAETRSRARSVPGSAKGQGNPPTEKV